MLLQADDVYGILNKKINSGGGGGVAPTVNVGTTTTSEAGTDATVVNSGNETNVILDFTIPRGYTPIKGIDYFTNEDIQEIISQIPSGENNGIKTCRFVIGTSQAGWTEKDCDYLCDGIDDQIEINQAIQDLPLINQYVECGEIIFLEGIYYLSDSISITKNCRLIGKREMTMLYWQKNITEEENNDNLEFSFIKASNNILIFSLLNLSCVNLTNIKNTLGLQLLSVQNSIIENNMFLNFNVGLYIINIKDLYLNNNTVEGNQGLGGIAVLGNNNQQRININIANNRIINYKRGIAVDYMYQSAIINCNFIKNFSTEENNPIYLGKNTINNLIIGNMLIGNNSYLDEGTNNTFAYNKTGLPDENIDPFKYTDSVIGDINSILDNINGEVI